MHCIMTEKTYESTLSYIVYNDLTSEDDQPVATGLEPLTNARYDISDFDDGLIDGEQNLSEKA